MFNTAYKPLQSIGKSLAPYVGGICSWWYVPIQYLDGFPAVDTLTQMLLSEPALKAGKNWYGPVNIVNKELGYIQVQTKTAAGPLWKRKVTGFLQGNDSASHINMSNLAYHQLCIVAKLRAGGFFIIIGNNEAGLSLVNEFDTGNGQMDTPGSKLSFVDEAKHSAMVLPSFDGIDSQPPPGGETITITVHDMEEFYMSLLGDTAIEWTSDLQTRFGNFPTIECWADDGADSYYRANFAIDWATAASPKTFIIRNQGAAGVIKIT